MKCIFLKYKWHLLLVTIAGLWMVVFGFLMQGHAQTFVSYDARSYVESAENLYLHWRGHNYRPMLMAAISGIPFVFGASRSAIIPFSFWVNLICWLASLLLVFEMAKHFLKPKLAFLFAIASAFLIGLNAMIFELATEHIYLFLILLAIYFLMRYYQTGYFKFLCFGLALLVLSMLVKPGAKFFAILLTLFFIKEIIFNYRSKFAWFIYGSYFLVFIQCAGVKYQFGNFTLSYIDAVTYYDYLGAKAEALQTDKPFKQVWLKRVTYIYSRPCHEQKQIASADFVKQLQSNADNFFKAYALNLIENSTTGSVQIDFMQNKKAIHYFEDVKTLVYSIAKWQNIFLSMLGFLLSVWAIFRFWKRENVWVITGGFILYTMLLSGVSCNEGDRFHIVTFPLVLILLGKFIVEKRSFFSAD